MLRGVFESRVEKGAPVASVKEDLHERARSQERNGLVVVWRFVCRVSFSRVSVPFLVLLRRREPFSRASRGGLRVGEPNLGRGRWDGDSEETDERESQKWPMKNRSQEGPMKDSQESSMKAGPQEASSGSGLNVVRVEFIPEPFPGLQFGVFDLGVELIDRHDLGGVVWRNQQVEIDGVVDGRFHDVVQRLFVNRLGAEVIMPHADLAFPFDEVLHFAIDENTSDQVAFVGAAVVFERIGQKVVDVDHPTVGVGLVFRYVRVLPDDVFAVEFEHVGVHAEDQNVVGHMQLCFEFPAVAVFDPHILLSTTFECVV